ncbi:MAG: hypothetical protein AAF518_20150 [Spirochaetota bacterium]
MFSGFVAMGGKEYVEGLIDDKTLFGKLPKIKSIIAKYSFKRLLASKDKKIKFCRKRKSITEKQVGNFTVHFVKYILSDECAQVHSEIIITHNVTQEIYYLASIAEYFAYEELLQVDSLSHIITTRVHYCFCC